jgi:hypothetical protein
MNVEEKRKALGDFCRRHDDCFECPLNKKVDCDLIDGEFTIPDEDIDKAIDKINQKVFDACGIPSHILDSGNRREFETGAVRDIQEGKGRCDLMPLDVVAMLGCSPTSKKIFESISQFQDTGDHSYLASCIWEYVDGHIILNAPNNTIGSKTCYMLLEVAKHFEEGAKKYGEYNWQKGIPTHCYIDSAVRHYLKYLRGDTDEPHDRAFCWNILCCIWTCIHKPELNDYAKKEDVQ